VRYDEILSEKASKHSVLEQSFSLDQRFEKFV